MSKVAKTDKCQECKGTGREVVSDEITDDFGEVLDEVQRDYGPCEICDGKGRLPAESPAQRATRQAQEHAATRARYAQETADHLASGRCTARDADGTGCYAPHRFHIAW